MKKILIFLASLFIGIRIFAWVVESAGWQQIKDAFFVFAGWQGIVILLLTFLMAAIGSWKWKKLLDEMGHKVSFQDVWKAYLASYSIRFLAPVFFVAAELFQGYVLKKKNLVPWSQGMASVIIDRVLEWTCNLLLIFLGSIFFLLTIGFPPLKLAIIFGIIFLIFLAAISFFYFKAFKKESIAKAIGKIFNHKLDNNPLETEKEIFNFFKLSKKRAMFKVFGLNLLRAGIMLLRTWLLIVFLGKNIGILSSVSVLGFTYLALMIPIPTALGSHEAIQSFSFNALSLGAPTATAFTMIIRGAELIVAFVGIIFLFRLGTFLISNIFLKKIKNISKNDNNRH